MYTNTDYNTQFWTAALTSSVSTTVEISEVLEFEDRSKPLADGIVIHDLRFRECWSCKTDTNLMQLGLRVNS